MRSEAFVLQKLFWVGEKLGFSKNCALGSHRTPGSSVQLDVQELHSQLCSQQLQAEQ